MKTTWFEEYKDCGCVCKPVQRKADLLGYCATHGTNSVRVYKERNGLAAALACGVVTEEEVQGG